MHKNFIIQKNSFKDEGSKQPDYRMSAKVGEVWEDIGGCWLKTNSKGEKFFSCSFSEKKVAPAKDIEYPEGPNPTEIPF